MADYSTNATQLQGPQGQGAQVVPPVESRATPSTVFSALGNVVDIFNKGMANSAKEDAKRRENEIVGQYVKEQTRINDAISQGLDAGQAGARSRASANKFLAQYPEYYKEFESAGKALKGITELGEAEDEEKNRRALYKERIGKANAAGYSIDASQPKTVIDLQLKAYDTAVMGRQRLQDLYAANAERRSQTSEERTIFDRELKQESVKMINEVAGTRLEATGAFMTNLAGDVRSGKITAEQGQIKLFQEFSTIEATLQAAASTNPELAAPYRSLFSDMKRLGTDMLDPKKAVEQQEDQIKAILNKHKLIMLATPKFATIVAGSQLLGANAQIALQAGAEITPLIAQMINTPAESKGYVPQVVGNPNVEKETIKFLKDSLNTYTNGKFPDGPKAKVEIGNTVNHVLKQVGERMDKGMEPKELKDLAAFIASPEYGSFSSSGALNKQAAQAAKKTFQGSYEPTMIKGVQQKLDTYLQGQAAFGQKQSAPTAVSAVVDANFTGSGVVFAAKPRAGLDPLEQADAAKAVKDLNSAQAAVNQLIHMGAHLEGHTNYGQYWEKNKHVFMPQLFIAPKKTDTTEAPSTIVKRTPAEDAMAKEVAPIIEMAKNYVPTDADIREIQKEIDKAKTPEIKQVLIDELNRSLRKREGK